MFNKTPNFCAMHGIKAMPEGKASYGNFFLSPIVTVKHLCSQVSSLQVRNLMASH